MDAAVKIFQAIKPKCVALAQLTLSENSKEGSLELLNALKDLDLTLKAEIDTALKHMNDQQFFIPINLSDYIMVPLTKLFQSDKLTDSELEYILSIIHYLLKYSWCQTGVLTYELFIQYVTLITFMIGGKPGQFSIKSHSDETFTNGILCLQDLLQGCLNQNSSFTSRVLENNKFVPTLGFLVSILLNIAVGSPIADIKAEALKTLNILFHLLDNGEILSLFFPGSVSSIAKIINAKPHSNVLCEAFTTLSTLVNYVFSDFDLNVTAENKIKSLDSLKSRFSDLEKENNDSDKSELDSSLVIEIPKDLNLQKQHRTTSWLNTTLKQFEKALKIILNIDFQRYDKRAVKDAVIQFSVKIIRNGFLTCYPLIPILLKTLSIVSATDPSFDDLIVDSLIYNPEKDSLKLLLIRVLEDELHHMQYTFSSPDTTKAEAMIQFIKFSIHLINSMNCLDISILIKVVERLRQNIALLIEIKNTNDIRKKISPSLSDSMETRLLLVSSHYDVSPSDEIKRVSLFDGIFTKKTESSLEELFESISLHSEKLGKLDSLLAAEEYSSLNVTGTIRAAVSSWIVSSVAKGFNTNRTTDIEDFLVFDDKSDSEKVSIISVEANDEVLIVQRNLAFSSLETCTRVLDYYSKHSIDSVTSVSSSIMCLRAINNTANVLKVNFEDELIDVLYPVVECLASSSDAIRTEAQIVILDLANLLYSGSVEQLLSENIDYLVDSLSSRLVAESLTPKIPIILSVLVKIGSMDIVAELDDIIRTIFTLLDMYHGYSSLVEGFFLVFDEILSKVYQQLQSYSFEKLASDSEDENVSTFGMWGLQSMVEVEEFINKYALAFEDLSDSENDSIEEPLKKSNILEIDSDNSDDENETKSIPSRINGGDSDDDGTDDNKWLSPINFKLYNTVTSILSYAERLVQTSSVSLVLLLLRIIERIIPLIATQKSKFLPIGANLWNIVFSILNEAKDLRVICRTVNILQKLIKYGHTFFVTRFLDLYTSLRENTTIKSTIDKQICIIIKSQKKGSTTSAVINQTSTSTNWDLNTFNQLCEFLIFSLVKLGRFIPNDTAMSIIKITLFFDKNANHYGYFDDLAEFLIEQEKQSVLLSH